MHKRLRRRKKNFGKKSAVLVIREMEWCRTRENGARYRISVLPLPPPLTTVCFGKADKKRCIRNGSHTLY